MRIVPSVVLIDHTALLQSCSFLGLSDLASFQFRDFAYTIADGYPQHCIYCFDDMKIKQSTSSQLTLNTKLMLFAKLKEQGYSCKEDKEKMADDLLHLLEEKPNVKQVFMLSSDIALIPLCKKIQEKGRGVISLRLPGEMLNSIASYATQKSTLTEDDLEKFFPRMTIARKILSTPRAYLHTSRRSSIQL